MENIPKAIYLNIGNDITDVQDFNALDDGTSDINEIPSIPR